MKPIKPHASKHEDHDHIYYDVSYFNSTNQISPLNVSDDRTAPLLKRPSDFHLSIVRFLIPTQYVPIFIRNPSNTYFSVTIRTAGVDYQSFLVYVPLNNLSPTDEAYYFVYSYQQFVDEINVALNASFMAAGGSATQPPYLTYDSKTGLFTLIAEYAYGTAAGEYQIYFNQPLYAFFDNFKSIKNTPFGQPNGKDYQLIIENTGVTLQSFAPGYSESVGVNAYAQTQENYTLYLWNSVRKIIFTSSIPVINENINISNNQFATTTNNTLKILTDFEVSLTTGSDWRSYQQYIPQGEYRLISLNSDTPMYKFDFQILFQTADQKVYQLYINPGEYFSMKVLFRNKNFKATL